MSMKENVFANGEWRNGQFYPYGSQSDFASTLAEHAERQQQASDWGPSDGLGELPAAPRKDISSADRELLELAARALGTRFEEVDGEGYGNLHFEDGSVVHAWNPLAFSGDAFELAVRLKITPHIDGNLTEAESTEGFFTEPHFDDAYAATRRAVTRAAAEIGKAMP